MQRISLLFYLFVICLATTMQAQAPAPKPDPELKKLQFNVGRWAYECDYKPTPLGPASKTTGEQTGQPILGGFFMEERWSEKGPLGVASGIEIDAYDPVNKNFTYSVYQNDGSVYSGTFDFNGNTGTSKGKLFVGGKQYWTRSTQTYAADWMSGTWKQDISTDGNTWLPWFEQKMTKVKPAAKK